jgi:hypothetical protein
VGRNGLFTALAIVLMLFTFQSCRAIFTDTGPLEIVAAADTITLAWDGAGGSELTEIPSAISHYELFYRPRGRREWVRLAESGGPTPTYTIRRYQLSYGEYEFAVRSVRNDGRVSQIHTSVDHDAWPPGGWYLKWIPGD